MHCTLGGTNNIAVPCDFKFNSFDYIPRYEHKRIVETKREEESKQYIMTLVKTLIRFGKHL